MLFIHPLRPCVFALSSLTLFSLPPKYTGGASVMAQLRAAEGGNAEPADHPEPALYRRHLAGCLGGILPPPGSGCTLHGKKKPCPTWHPAGGPAERGMGIMGKMPMPRQARAGFFSFSSLRLCPACRGVTLLFLFLSAAFAGYPPKTEGLRPSNIFA